MVPEDHATGCLVLGSYAKRTRAGKAGAMQLSRAGERADRAAKGAITRALARGDLPHRVGATLLLHAVSGLKAQRVLLVSFGDLKELGVAKYRDALRGAATALKDLACADATLAFLDLHVPGRSPAWHVGQAVMALRDAFYRFDQLKTRKKAPAPALVRVTLAQFPGPVAPEAQRTLKEAVATADGVAFARTLGNLPSNICTPSYLADEARKLAKQFKLDIEVLERRDMDKLGMGALVSVTRGSREAPKLIVLKYRGAERKARPIVFVGKGITFDTGGISLKPAGEMDEMKFDMSGAGSVLGALRALAGMRAPLNAIGVIPACENMPGGGASKPGDIVTTLSGQTVEVLNTDAEGRLILCDALTYAERFNPEVIVDIATLTGACVIALGHIAAGVFANDQKLADELLAAGEDAWDRCWQLPLWEDYQEQLRSNFADMANIGGRPAGSITAASFLARFTRKQRWAHLDVAGTAWKSGREKGSTGRPVPLLVKFALRHAKPAR
ncbi:MAG: leucyl aminopeptidase [Betaproteobacteria bacterium]|nr:leucyl aminopeptidase [Betaproteobacteria bacterium]